MCQTERKDKRKQQREVRARGGAARKAAKTRHFSPCKSLERRLLLNGRVSVQSHWEPGITSTKGNVGFANPR